MIKKTAIIFLLCGSVYALPQNKPMQQVLVSESATAATVEQRTLAHVVEINEDGELVYYSPQDTDKIQPYYPVLNVVDKFTSVVYGGRQFVAVGEKGLIARSKNGKDWELQNSDTKLNLLDVRYSPESGYTVYGQDDLVLVSENAERWQTFNQPTAVSSDNSASGMYVNVNAGITQQQWLPKGMTAIGANVGYNFNHALAVEAGYTNLFGEEFGASQTNNIFNVAVKGTLPLSNVFSLYGRLGGGLNYFSWGGVSNIGTPDWYNNQRSSVNFVGLVAGGASFAISDSFSLRLEDTLFVPLGGGNRTTGQINIISGGVQYDF